MNKTKKPIIFLQEWGTYPFDTIIAIGGTIEDIENFFKIKKFKFKDFDFQGKKMNNFLFIIVFFL